jgi:hypothetical protein
VPSGLNSQHLIAVIKASDTLEIVRIEEDIIVYRDTLEACCAGSGKLAEAMRALNVDMDHLVLNGIPPHTITGERVQLLGLRKFGHSSQWRKFIMPGASDSASRDGANVIILKCCQAHRGTLTWSQDAQRWIAKTSDCFGFEEVVRYPVT